MVNPPIERAQLCIVQPRGYVHSLGFLDQARYLQHHLSRLGVQTSVAKNRLAYDAVNFVFGAHLGFDPRLVEQYRCVLVNLEQLGEGGANVGQHYLRLLGDCVTIDYDAANVPAYRGSSAAPLIGFADAPYLHPGQECLPLAERPIDLLFVGSTNARRQELIKRIEATGVSVAMFDSAVYGPERDEFVRQAKAVLNVHFYDTARFAQARASFVLSQGTPLISELQRDCAAPRPYQQSVLWFDPERIGTYFGEYFRSESFYSDAARCLDAFKAFDPLPNVEAIWDYALCRLAAEPRARLPKQLNARMDQVGYRLGWLNASPDPANRPDWIVDLERPLPHSEEVAMLAGLETAHLGLIDLGSRGTPAVFDNALLLLDEGGVLVFELACSGETEREGDGWVRQLLSRYTSEFWRQGWLDYRFHLEHLGFLDQHLQPLQPGAEGRAVCRVVLKKVPCSLRERTVARTAREDFGFGHLLSGN